MIALRCLCESCAEMYAVPPAPTFTRAHRLACEVRMVLALPFDRRREYLAEVEKRRGLPARKGLEVVLLAEHARRRSGATD